MTDKFEQFALDVAKIVQDRTVHYGYPSTHWTKVAKLWSTILDHTISPEQAVLCMVGLKIMREAYVHKLDNISDILGYGLVLFDITEDQNESI